MTGRIGQFSRPAAAGALLALVAAGCGDPGFSEGYLEATARRTQNQLVNEVRLRARQFAPTEMRVDLTDASERERELLSALLRAAGLADEIFWRQAGPLAVPYRAQVRAAYPSDHIVREFYLLQRGPYDRLDGHRPYMDVPPKPAGAGFYPSDLAAEEFRAWLDEHPGDRAAFLDPYTVIRRQGQELVAVPYHRAYRELVEPLAAALRDAASHAADPGLQRFLELKARAVLTDDHRAADTAWVRLEDARFQMVIGPQETGEDRLLNLKTAYGASVGLVDTAASAELARFRGHLEEIEATLPIPDPPDRDTTRRRSTFTVVRDIYRGGRLGTGPQRVAARLPTGPAARSPVGTKTILWKNVLDARFDSIVAPIGREALAEDQREDLSAEAFLDVVVSRELARGLGPRYASSGEERAPVDRAPGTHHPWIREIQAHQVGVLAMERLAELGALDAGAREARLAAHLASLLRAVRFGTGEPRGRAALVSLNWHLREGGVTFDSAATRYRVEPDAMVGSARGLAEEVFRVRATGDRARAERLREEFGEVPPSLESVLGALAHLPVEVAPRYRIRW